MIYFWLMKQIIIFFVFMITLFYAYAEVIDPAFDDTNMDLNEADEADYGVTDYSYTDNIDSAFDDTNKEIIDEDLPADEELVTYPQLPSYNDAEYANSNGSLLTLSIILNFIFIILLLIYTYEKLWVPKSLKNYIAWVMKLGYPINMIKNLLIQQGWPETKIKRACKKATKGLKPGFRT